MTGSYLEWQEHEDMNPPWVLTLVIPGRDPIMLVCFDKPIEVRGHAPETRACRVCTGSGPESPPYLCSQHEQEFQTWRRSATSSPDHAGPLLRLQGAVG